MSKAPCLAQQFHNCLEIDTDSLLNGDLKQIWQPLVRILGTPETILGTFRDGSWYARVREGADSFYVVADDENDMALQVMKMERINKKIASNITMVLFEDMMKLAEESVHREMRGEC